MPGLQGLVLEGVRRNLKELHDAVGEEGGLEEAERSRGLIRRLMVSLGYEEPEQARGRSAQMLNPKCCTQHRVRVQGLRATGLQRGLAPLDQAHCNIFPRSIK